MEFAIPIIALSGLYYVAKGSRNENGSKTGQEGYQNSVLFSDQKALPNTDIPNVNYPNEYIGTDLASIQLERTSEMDNVNFYKNYNYTDKYFNTADPNNVFSSKEQNHRTMMDLTKNGQDKEFQTLDGRMETSEYFKHNNMVPFIKKKHHNFKVDSNPHEGLLDNYTGSGSTFIDKREQAPLFSPNENYNWAYGAPNQNDFFQSRVNPGAKIANVLPFQQETVGPGIGLGYTADAMGGYNSGLLSRELWLDKNIDELRVDNHRKPHGVGLFGHEGPAISFNTQMGSIGQVEKHRPDTTFEVGQDRYLTTTGIVKEQPYRPIHVDRHVSRPETTQNYTGVANASEVGTYIDGEHMPSHNIQLGSYPVTAADAVGKGNAQITDYEAKSQINYMNNRAANIQPDYFGIVGGAVGAMMAPILDILRPSRKQNVIGTLRPYQNPATTVTQSYYFNPGDQAPVTIRQTTENAKFHLNANSNEYNRGGYIVTENQPIINARMDQSDFYYAGNSSAQGGAQAARTYDAEYRQRNNDVKSSTIDGRLVPGNMSLMNNSANIRAGDRNTTLLNNRDPVHAISNTTTMPPSLETMGQMQGRQQQLYANSGLDRTQSDILTALKGNPYALSITGSI